MSSASSSDVIELVRTRHEPTTVDGERGPTASAAAVPGTEHRPISVGRYALLETIGRGGMGVVCTAYDPKLDRKVALKLLRQAPGDDRKQRARRARMVREAQALARLSHPNVITVHDVDSDGERLFIAMEYVEGCTIAQWLQQKARTWREIVDVFVHAGRGLAAAHAAGIVHRDFKPSNVLIGDDGRVRVLDFGLAKTAEDGDFLATSAPDPDAGESMRSARSRIAKHLGSVTDVQLTQAGRAVGTPAYMAPEQLLSQEVGDHTDQFAFGIALYEALYGRHPFGGTSNIRELVDRVTEGNVIEPPRDANVPSWVHRVVLRALQVDPAARFPSMKALLAALDAAPARRRLLWIAGGLAVLLAGGGGALAFGAMSSPVERCRGAQTEIEEIWNPERRHTVQASFGATRLSYAPRTSERALAQLDAFAETWATTHTTVCEATNLRGDQSAALMDHRMACLERARTELDTLLGVFEQADAQVVLKAPTATDSLADPAACATEQPGHDEPLSEDPVTKAAIRDIDRRLARARTLEYAGKYDDALTLATAIRVDAETLAHDAATARALFQEALALRRSRRAADAEEQLEAAIRHAARAGLAELEARGWLFLVLVEGTQNERFERAIAHGLAAEAAIERAGNPLELRARLAQHLAGVYAMAQRWEDAITPASDAVSRWQDLRGPDSLDVANARHDRAVILAGLQRPAEAERELVAALDVLEKAYGAEHPKVASAALALGSTLERKLDDDGAVREYRRALAIFRKLGSDDDPALAGPLLGIGQIEMGRDPAAARESLEHALRLLDTTPPRSSQRLAMALQWLALLDLRAARLSDAQSDPTRAEEHVARGLVRFDRAVELFTKLHGPEHRSVLRNLRGRCEALLRLGRLQEARHACDAAAAGDPEDEGERADLLLTYGQLLAKSDRTAAELVLRVVASPVDSADDDPTRAARARLALAEAIASDPKRRDESRAMARSARELIELSRDDAVAAELARWFSTRG